MSKMLFNANSLRSNNLCNQACHQLREHHYASAYFRKPFVNSVLLTALTSLAVISLQFGFTYSAHAQSSGLRPPIILPSNNSANSTANNTVNNSANATTSSTVSSALKRPSISNVQTQGTPIQATQIQSTQILSKSIQTRQVNAQNPVVQVNQTTPQAMSLTRFQTLKVNGKVVDLRNLSNNDVLVGKNGKSISVARIKQLQARLSANTNANAGRSSSKPMIIARQGQTIRSLSNEPASTIINLPNNRQIRAQDLAKVQTVLNRLAVKRIVKPIPMSMNNAQAQAVVGQNISLDDALKRPGSDIIQVGSRKYSVDQLRFIDSQLKASKFDPRGLSDRIGKGRNTKLNNPATPRSSLNGGGVK